jgi:hypothetical protein
LPPPPLLVLEMLGFTEGLLVERGMLLLLVVAVEGLEVSGGEGEGRDQKVAVRR